MVNRAAKADMTPKSKSDPFKELIKYKRISGGSIPKAMP
jgi:hypothetical protein